ncbi:MAG TPA: DUF3748 domain-containing protein [Candidatus Hydrogenedentes bacterium]|nr:DUF3748 domain-containing protein [Candidatus Hydrogenedentota bacterium]HRT66769.1 DUF3748 domain-containing protein [Candidatus Hydrogenedentota bacterium]
MVFSTGNGISWIFPRFYRLFLGVNPWPAILAAVFSIFVFFMVMISPRAEAEFMTEQQITFSPKHHWLDNNDNFSSDGRFLCYDTREMVGPGIENSQSIEKVEIATGKETVLYRPAEVITGAKAAPGVGAASFSPVADAVAFIHGPPVSDVPRRGFYAKPNRNGAEVSADGGGKLAWLDFRDVETARDTLPGAHRGGTHRHEYSLDGRRIGFTYDDFLLPQYERTIGYMERHPKAPGGALCWFAVLVPVVPKGTSKPGEIERALGDSWIGREGLMRAFIGTVREDDGVGYQDSLFVVDIPNEVDITTADAGGANRYPSPPKGTRIRRLTHAWACGTVRGSPDGRRIAYYGHAEDGLTQIFIIPSDGSDRSGDPAKRPVQATHFAKGAGPGLRWHPSGDTIFCISDNGIAATCVKPGRRFGKTRFLTPRGDGPPRIELVVSPDGRRLAYTKPVPTKDESGARKTAYNGADCQQIFIIDFARGRPGR